MRSNACRAYDRERTGTSNAPKVWNFEWAACECFVVRRKVRGEAEEQFARPARKMNSNKRVARWEPNAGYPAKSLPGTCAAPPVVPNHLRGRQAQPNPQHAEH